MVFSVRSGLSGLFCLVLLAGCASEPAQQQHQSDSRYTMDQDKGPDGDFDISQVVVPEPRYQERSRGGNFSPYTVWGKTYEVMDSAHGYREEGIASWYGAKFHGHKTSNGEVYDMYTLTAAHRSLPLPTYVRVTNLENDRSTIVRVNDRGPFHEDRVIDLSFAAAKMLGFHNKGTARVEVEALATRPDNNGAPTAEMAGSSSNESPEAVAAGDDSMQLFVQVGAFGDPDAANALRRQLADVVQSDVRVYASEDGSIHRVRVGPIKASRDAESERDRIVEQQLGQPIIIARPIDSNE